MVSMIFGMQVRIARPQAETVLEGEFYPAPFINLWKRQQTGPKTDQQLCAYYQSVLDNVVWAEHIESNLLNSLKAATQDDMLSINFNVYSLQAKLADDGNSLTADFGNTFPIIDSSGAPTNLGPVQLGVLRTNPQQH